MLLTPPDTRVAAAASAPASRRERALGGGQDILLEVLGEKVLHGWLQNRHQTLFPLTVSLRTLEPAKADALARFLAVGLLAQGPVEDEAATKRVAAARAWFAGAGASPAALASLDAALADPPALSRIMADITAAGLAAYGYVAMLVALDARDPASAHLLDYVAARLGLPTTVVQSANRRYRK